MTSPDKASLEGPKRIVVTVEFGDEDSAKIRAAVARFQAQHFEMNPHRLTRFAVRRIADAVVSGESVLGLASVSA